MTRNHHRRRLQWARDHQHCLPGHWDHVVFSEESRFLVYRQDGRKRVRRMVGEIYHKDCIAPRVQVEPGGGLTVWASFHADGKSDLVFLEETLNQHRYRDILQQALLPFTRATFRDNFVFQDDNVRPHRARMIQDFIHANGIEHMEWPALSPDVNPISRTCGQN